MWYFEKRTIRGKRTVGTQMVDSEHEADGLSLESRLGVFLLKDPTLIERLPADQGRRLDKLIEANSLEPLLYRQVEELEVQNRVTNRRISSWKMARLCAKARATSYRTALDEIVEVTTQAGIALRLLRGTQVSFQLCEEPELRPVNGLEIQTPPEDAPKLYRALQARGFEELDDLSSSASHGHGEHHLPSLDREGVTVTIFKHSCARLPDYDDEPFPMDHHDPQNNPEVLRGEPLLTLLILGIFEQSFCRALTSLLDLHRILGNLQIDWQLVGHIARDLKIEKQFFCVLTMLEELFNSPVDKKFLAELHSAPCITSHLERVALPMIRSLSLQYPVPFEEVKAAQAFFSGDGVAVGASRETPVLPRLVQWRLR